MLRCHLNHLRGTDRVSELTSDRLRWLINRPGGAVRIVPVESQIARASYIKLRDGIMDAAMDSLTAAWNGPRSGLESDGAATRTADSTNGSE